ncbi:MAG TPA: AMP-binding protein, partial [Gemmatimonadaceae bacterium]|nr:AMP-binding protein [Gemmatimonadaceae bacterium]
MNAAALFNTRERHDPGALALRWDGGAMTYGELGTQARRAAAALAARGVGVDDRVALLLPNDPRFAVALLGTLWLGATAAVLSPVWRGQDVLQALLDADVSALVTTQALAAALGALPCPTLLVDVATGYESFAHALASARVDLSSQPLHRAADEPATILYSSGTTGEPKGVVLSHGNLVFNAESKGRYCGIEPNDALALVVPISHCFGQNVVLLGAFAAGASVRLYPRFDVHQLCAGIARGEVSHLYAPPPVFQGLLEVGTPVTLRRLRCALSAAAPLAEPLAARWRESTGRALRQGYGLTESSPFATYADDGAVDVG